MKPIHKKYIKETGKSPYSGDEYKGDLLYTNEFVSWLEKTAIKSNDISMKNKKYKPDFVKNCEGCNIQHIDNHSDRMMCVKCDKRF